MSDVETAGGAAGDPLEIRHAREADLPAIDLVYNHYVATSHVTFDIDPLTSKERREWFRVFSDRGRYQLFVAYRGSQFLGYAHSRPLRPKGAYETSVRAWTCLRCRNCDAPRTRPWSWTWRPAT